MKVVFKLLIGLVTLIVFLAIAGLSFLKWGIGYPEAETLKVELDPLKVQRGEYLANAVAACTDCHGQRDYSLWSGPLVAGTLGKGGEKFGKDMGFPGDFYAKNITPHALSDWTDGEILRAMTMGVNKQGEVLFPVMPWQNYAQMDREDLEAIISYLRSMTPVVYNPPASKATFPMNLIMNTFPQIPMFSKRPDPATDLVAYGKYMTTMASCTDCHTQKNKGVPLPDMEFAGGMKFKMPIGTAVSANITPDKETGIGAWTEEAFVQKFKHYQDSTYVDQTVESLGRQTVMPWKQYALMKEEDLKAIYAYLQSIQPVNNQVEPWIK